MGKLVVFIQIITHWMSLNEWKSTKRAIWDTSHDYIFICLIFRISESSPTEHAKLWGEDFQENSFKGSGRLSLCRRIAVSFADGDWAQVQFTYAKTVSKIMWKNRPHCSSEINLTASHQFERDQHFIQLMKDVRT